MKTIKILGPPGTGKTKTMLDLLAKEVERGVPLNRIAFLTFTRAAREEALSRLGAKELPFVRTIHSLCYRQLELTPSQIAHAKDVKYFGKLIGVKLTGTTPSPWSVEDDPDTEVAQPTKDDLLLQMNHLGRHRVVQLREAMQDLPEDIDFRYAKWFTQSYREWKKKEGLHDYTDMLTAYLKNGHPLPVTVLFVDEAQDLSKLQWQVIHKMAAQAQRVYLAGDDDQAIYSWAGAAAHEFIIEPADETRVLEQSWRLPASVHRLALKITSQIKERLEKDFKPRNEEGEVGKVYDITAECLSGDTLALFRHHFRGRQLASRLYSLAVPWSGLASPYDRHRVVLTAWRKLIMNGKVTAPEAWSLVQGSTLEYLVPGIAGKASKDISREITCDEIFLRRPQLEQFADYLPKLSGIDVVARSRKSYTWESIINPSVRLMSIHQAKGRQAETVLLDTELARKTYDAQLRDPDDEHRVWYVAVTRASRRLISIASPDPKTYNLPI